jgi:hypothetical protein
MESITNNNEISHSPRYHQHQPILESFRFSSLFSARAQMTRSCVIKLAQNPTCFQTSTCSIPTFIQASEYHASALSTSRSPEIFTPKKSPDHPSALSSNPTPSLPTPYSPSFRNLNSYFTSTRHRPHPRCTSPFHPWRSPEDKSRQ